LYKFLAGKRLPHRFPFFRADYRVQPNAKINFICFFTNKSNPHSVPKKKSSKTIIKINKNLMKSFFVQFLLQLTEQLFIILHSRLVMSSKKLTISKNFSFVERFIEVCGSSQPNEVAQLLNISYQAAKNYLQGRLPDSKVLIIISEKTPYSINWLLTGEGKKFVKDSINQDTAILSDQMETFVRQICLEIIGEMLSNRNDLAQQKVIVLTSDNIKEEKILDESAVFSENINK